MRVVVSAWRRRVSFWRETRKGRKRVVCLFFTLSFIFFSECQSSDGNLGKANQCGYKQWSVSVEQLLSFVCFKKLLKKLLTAKHWSRNPFFDSKKNKFLSNFFATITTQKKLSSGT